MLNNTFMCGYMIMSMDYTNNQIIALLFYRPAKSQYWFGQLYVQATHVHLQ